MIGRGSFGKVLLVRGKQDKKVYALKILSKSQVVARKQVEHTQSERKILEEVAHPFLCPLEFAFQTEEQLYFGMPFLAGGSLFYHLQQVCWCGSFSLSLLSVSLHNPSSQFLFTIPLHNISSQSLSWKYLFTTPLISRTDDSQRREPGFTARRLFWELAIFTNTTSSTGIFYFDVKR